MSEPADDPRRVAIAAIVRIDEDGAFANVLLPKMLAETSLDRRDRGFTTELVYGSTRMRRKLDHLVDRFLLEPPPPSARAALRIGAHQLLHLDTPPHAAVSATVAAAPKRFRGLVVPTGDGELELLEVQPEGKPRMDAAAWANGARWTRDQRFGS